MKNNRALLIAICGAFAALVIGLIINWSMGNSVTNAGEQRQADLMKVYPDTQNYLSDCEVKSSQAAQVAGAEVAGYDKILTDTIKGRYDNKGGVPDGTVNSTLFIQAVREAYPNLNNVGVTFQRVLEVINGCRSDYRNAQTKLLSELGEFDKWRKGSWKTRHYGGQFPNNDLVARINGVPTYGKAAEEQMYRIVLTSTANKEYQKGELDPSTINIFPTTTND